MVEAVKTLSLREHWEKACWCMAPETGLTGEDVCKIYVIYMICNLISTKTTSTCWQKHHWSGHYVLFFLLFVWNFRYISSFLIGVYASLNSACGRTSVWTCKPSSMQTNPACIPLSPTKCSRDLLWIQHTHEDEWMSDNPLLLYLNTAFNFVLSNYVKIPLIVWELNIYLQDVRFCTAGEIPAASRGWVIVLVMSDKQEPSVNMWLWVILWFSDQMFRKC